jgi:hypothetical protein
LAGRLEIFKNVYNFGRIGRAYAELFPGIQEERPDVMEKLFEMRSQLDELKVEQCKKGFINR